MGALFQSVNLSVGRSSLVATGGRCHSHVGAFKAEYWKSASTWLVHQKTVQYDTRMQYPECVVAAGLAEAPAPEHPPLRFPCAPGTNIFPTRRSVHSADSNPSASVPSGHGCHLRLARRK